MGSRLIRPIKGLFLFPFFFVFLPLSAPLYAQKAATPPMPLGDEISRLEKASRSSAPSGSFEAFMALARLNWLSGYYESALESLDDALELFPGNGSALFEKGRLLISLGEYEKAAALSFDLIDKAIDKESKLIARYLSALLEAYRSRNFKDLAALADENDFSDLKSAIYYTLWKLTDASSWEARLKAEFPRGPEAKIADGSALLSQSPHWLLFPGRESVSIAATASAAPVTVTPAPPPPAAQPVTVTPPAVSPAAPAGSGTMLQTGLFSSEAIAGVLSDRLKKAGFTSEIVRRQVNGNDYWAVTVPAGNDMNATIKKLKDSGFDSFPLKP
jgi:hypothetical protein